VQARGGSHQGRMDVVRPYQGDKEREIVVGMVRPEMRALRRNAHIGSVEIGPRLQSPGEHAGLCSGSHGPNEWVVTIQKRQTGGGQGFHKAALFAGDCLQAAEESVVAMADGGYHTHLGASDIHEVANLIHGIGGHLQDGKLLVSL